MTVKEGNLGVYTSMRVCIHALRVKGRVGDVCMLGLFNSHGFLIVQLTIPHIPFCSKVSSKLG